MGMKTILVPTEQHELMNSTLQTALLLARKFDSYMEGFAMFPAMVELFALDTGGPLPIEVKENDAEMAKQARGLFEKFMSDHGMARSGKTDGSLSFGWLDAAPDGDAIRRQLRPGLRRHRVGPPRAGRSQPSMTAIEAGLFETGRPVLVAPPSPPQRIGENILIAWNCSTEQARTTALAMPLLQRANRVTVLTVEGGTVPGPTGEQLARYLQRNGVPCERVTVAPEGRSTGEVILAQCGVARLRPADQGRLHPEPTAPDDLRRRHPSHPGECDAAGPDGALIAGRQKRADDFESITSAVASRRTAS